MLDKSSIKETCIDPIKKEWLAAGDSFPDFLAEIHKETKIKKDVETLTVTISVGATIFRQEAISDKIVNKM